MKASQILELLASGALSRHADLYDNVEAQSARYAAAVKRFCELYGDDRDIELFSVPGRSELSGNHTDHNHGAVLAGAINRDIIAVAAKTDDGMIRLQSEGYPEDAVALADVSDPSATANFSSAALIAGVCDGLIRRGEKLVKPRDLRSAEFFAHSDSRIVLQKLCVSCFGYLYRTVYS